MSTNIQNVNPNELIIKLQLNQGQNLFVFYGAFCIYHVDAVDRLVSSNREFIDIQKWEITETEQIGLAIPTSIRDRKWPAA